MEQPDRRRNRIDRSPRPHWWPWAVLAVATASVVWWRWPNRGGPSRDLPLELSPHVVFTAESDDPYAIPDTRMVALPEVPGNCTIWGATGRDERGHIWVGVSVHDAPYASARLIQYDPQTDRATNRGDVLAALTHAELIRIGEGQPKIHSKIVPAPDGCLYFASMDDVAEEGGPRPPKWGGHLWRVRPPTYNWEHLLAAPEGLIAVTGAQHLIYVLGYPDHRLIRYDTRTGDSKAITVGSVGGHVSRNIFADDRGHVYVPRLQGRSTGRLECALVEFDTGLQEVATHPLGYYLTDSPAAAHGIVGFQHLPDHSVAFVTHIGRLYRVIVLGLGPAQVVDLGWLHPNGESYSPALFTYSGTDVLVSAGRRLASNDASFRWLCYDLRLRTSFESRLPLPERNGMPLREVLLYGSEARDASGAFYLGGQYLDGSRGRPLLLRVQPKPP